MKVIVQLPGDGELLSHLDETTPSPKSVKYDGRRKIHYRMPIVKSSDMHAKQIGHLNTRKRHFHHINYPIKRRWSRGN